MKPMGIRPFTWESCKHRVSGAMRKKGHKPWWIGEIPPSKSRERQRTKQDLRKYKG